MKNVMTMFIIFSLCGCTASYRSMQEKWKSDLKETEKTYPSNIEQLIKNGAITTGMTKQQIKNVCGDPKNKNTHQTLNGESEQWVYAYSDAYMYRSIYFYFQDGILESWSIIN